MVSGKGKWQQWIPKLERSRSDLRKPCYPQCAGIPLSKKHGSRSHPDNVWFSRDGRAPTSWWIFQNSQTTRPLRRQGLGLYQSQPGLFAVKHAAREVPINRHSPRWIHSAPLEMFSRTFAKIPHVHTSRSGWQLWLYHEHNIVTHYKIFILLKLGRFH